MCSSVVKYKNWSKIAHDDYALTIGDIKNLKPGDQLKVLSMNRNIWDGTLNKKQQGRPYEPEYFFRNEWAIYVHDKDLTGRMLFFAFECEKFGLDQTISELDPDTISPDKICQPNFEFDLEYKPCCWYPLHDGYLPESDPQGFSKFPWKEKRHWTSFPDTTRVGWRGPFIRWDKLKSMPNILYPFPKEVRNAFMNAEDITVDRQFHIKIYNDVINSICTKYDIENESPKMALGNFCWHLRENDKSVIDFPIEFDADIIETTTNSTKKTYCYHVLIEKDGSWINGLKRLGQNIITQRN
jgi:hypothetical protein